MNYITEEMKQGPFFDYCFDKNRLKKWISKLYDETIGTEDVTIIKFIESLKTFGFNEATKAGISIGIDDLKIPPQKRKLLKKVESGTQLANDGLQNKTITPLENFQLTIDLWHKTNETIKNEVVTNFESTDTLNPVYMMAFSGARGNLSQVTQLLGMRGFMSDPEGQIIDFPIRSNFREGLTLTEYIISCYGARKGLVDTALRTADAGYLTRRLVDVAHTLVITVHDCNPKNPTWLSAIKENNKIIYSLEDRLVGRVLADNISINYLDKEKNKIVKEVWPYFKKYKQLSHLDAKLLGSCFKFVRVRSPLSCIQRHSLCQLCYGWTLPHSHLAPLGEAVGIIAAQSIGEPGTQLTMRTFHTGGVFSGALSDEILAPYSGIIEYDRAVIGAMFRLSNGKLGFLIQEPVTIQIKPPQNQSLIQPFFEMDLPPNSVLFLKNSEKVQQNQLLLELPKEKDDENETLLNEYSYYSKTSGLLKLEESHLKPSLNLLPFKNYKNKRLRGLKNTLKKEQKDLIQKQKLGFAYLPMQEQNQKYNSVKIYHGEICYATTLTTLPKVGDIVNQNSLVALSEFTHITETTLTNSIDYNKFKANKILKHHANSFLNLKLEKTIFNRQYQIGNEIYRGVNLGGLKTSKRTGQIIYLTKEMIKCQAIDQFIMSTNSKFFCRNDQLILKNTRLYTDFYPRLQMGDIVQGIPKIEEFFEARRSKKGLPFEGNLHNRLKERFNFYYQYCGYPLPIADRRSITDIQTYIIGSIFKLYSSQGINISDKHLELIVRQMTSKVKVTEYFYGTNWFEIAVLQSQPIVNEYYSRYIIEKIYRSLIRAIPSVWKKTHLFRYVFHYEPIIFGITQASLDSFGFISAASFQETTKILTQSSILQKTDYLKGLKENVVLGHLIPAGTALQTTLKVGTSKPLFKRQQFKTKFSKLLINRCKLESQLKYQSGSYSCHYSYKKAYKYTNPILYLFLYVYCVYYDQPRVL
uniref:RNA polymerase beta'' subunit n=1 Tax=Tetraselmis suecica TaxID=270643 RepID=UPI0021D51C5E|nr:RNA polymerase beta'' subunit [Tetraselmis suecica]UXF58524.1 RNA polymerase beta'' subunit [Tetraselmis suecica]